MRVKRYIGLALQDVRDVMGCLDRHKSAPKREPRKIVAPQSAVDDALYEVRQTIQYLDLPIACAQAAAKTRYKPA